MKQIAVVGGVGGLGSALVQRLLDESYKVVVIGRTKPADPRIEKSYQVDATRVEWPGLLATIEEESGGPSDAIVFVAGTAVFGKTALIPLERARETFELNFWACTTAARAAAQYWAQKGLPGKFVAILSIVARQAVPFEAYYAASKAATARFLECLQIEYAHKNIEFVCAYPGLLRTAFRQQAGWYGFQPTYADQGADVHKTSQAVIDLLRGRRKTQVIGWRERGVDLAGRFLPGLYERTILRKRTKRMLG